MSFLLRRARSLFRVGVLIIPDYVPFWFEDMMGKRERGGGGNLLVLGGDRE